MSNLIAESGMPAAAFILQDRKRLPVRFFGAFSGTSRSRLS